MPFKQIAPKPSPAETEMLNIDTYIKETQLLLQTAAHYQNKGYIKDSVVILQRVHLNLTYLATMHDIHFTSDKYANSEYEIISDIT